MNRVTAVMKLHTRDKWTWMGIPALILGSSFAVNYVVGLILEQEMFTGGLASIFVYMLVAGILCMAQTFPFALGFSVRRTDYFIGTSLTFLITSAVLSVGTYVLGVVESDLTGGWGTQLHFFSLPYLNDGSALEQLWIYFALAMTLFYLGFLISAIYRRFGIYGMYVFFGTLTLGLTVLVLLSAYYGWWMQIGSWFIGRSAFELALRAAVGGVVFAGVSYLLIRRATPV